MVVYFFFKFTGPIPIKSVIKVTLELHASLIFKRFLNSIIPKRIARIHGNPWKSKSPQSISFIPTAPPATHLILPQMCGSGTNGANPKVAQTIRTVFQELSGFDLFSSFCAMGR